jgi:hypothetical protein
MTREYWKTGASAPRREKVLWPSPAQVVRQLGIVALISSVWGALLAGCIQVTNGQTPASPGDEPVSVAAAAASTPAAQSVGAATPTMVSTALAPSPTSPAPTQPLATPAAPPEPAGTQESLPASEPSPEATDTIAPSSTPTETPLSAPTSVPAGETSGVSFSQDVLPIFERRCVKCHGGEKTEEGLVLKTYADVIAGSFNGLVVEPGDAEGSYLVQQIVRGKMPKKGPRLLPAEIQAISDWIDAGAPGN